MVSLLGRVGGGGGIGLAAAADGDAERNGTGQEDESELMHREFIFRLNDWLSSGGRDWSAAFAAAAKGSIIKLSMCRSVRLRHIGSHGSLPGLAGHKQAGDTRGWVYSGSGVFACGASGCAPIICKRFQIPQAAAEHELGQHLILLGNGAGMHEPPVEQHAARVEHVPEGVAVGLPAGARAFQRGLAAGDDLVAIQQGFAAGGINLHRQLVNLLADRKLVVSQVQFGGFELRFVALDFRCDTCRH